MDLVELETFIAVAQAGSFSVAATNLHVTQPTVTGRVQRLEHSLGTQLLRRTTRQVEVTADGALLLAESIKALNGLSNLVRHFRSQVELARETVIVAATPMLATFMPSVVKGYLEQFPGVTVELRDLQHADVLAAIDDGSADIGVIAFEGAGTKFRFEPLWTDDMLLVVPRGHPLASFERVSPADLTTHALMLIEQHQRLRAVIAEAAEQQGLHLPPSRVVANLNTLLGMLNAGMGPALLPRSLATRGDTADHALIEIEGVDLARHFGIVIAKRKVLNSSEQSFCRYLTQSIPPLIAAQHLHQL
ncbi:hypothetical protein BCY88_09870 [Paraburkholderia fungorum]|uniref:HTH lysR-type domain-containing protein n=1 Tax=Paraburkholderia fungorum TaxID=134537 RepID=A0A420FKZ8_9BURK|nr:hypothetical protein BCY88_09870 [Paraburkholderia fungorum]